MSKPQPPPDEAVPAPPPARSRGRQTALDMVRSLVLILGIVVVVLLLAPQPGPVEQPQVDDQAAVQAVAAAADALGAAPLLLRGGPAEEGLDEADVPEASAVVPLGEGWRLDYTRTSETADVPTWRVGVLSPGERRVELEQAVEPGEEWLTRPGEGRAGLPEPVEVGGLTWTRQERGSGGTTYTHVGAGSADGPPLTTAVTATSDSDDLRQVVEQVAAALPG